MRERTVKTKIQVKRHVFLLAVYGLLLLESVYHAFHAGGVRALRPEALLAIGIFAAYVFVSRVFEYGQDHAMLNEMLCKTNCGVAFILMDTDLILQRTNSAFFSINGYTPEEFREKFQNKFVKLVYPDDLPAVLADIRKLTAKSTHLHADFRILNKWGQIRWLHMDAFLFKKSGRVPLFFCVFTDSTDIRAFKEQGEMETERYRIISHLSDDILFDYDIKSKKLTTTHSLVNSNDESTVISDCDFALLKRDYVYEEDLIGLFRFWNAVKKGNEKIEMELRIRNADDEYLWRRVEGIAIRDRRGAPLTIVGRIVDIDKQKRETEYLTQKMQRDPMTGVFNKVVTEQLIDQYLHRGHQDKISALFIIDIDNFKHINDTMGHLSGDKFLTGIACELGKNLRSTDILGRIGGDEFLVFLKGIDRREVAEQKAAKLCTALREVFLENEQNYAVSGSIGISLYPADGATYEELFAKADQALYTAKGKGKDGYAFYETSDPVACELEKLSHTHARRGVSQPKYKLPHRQQIMDDFLAFLDEHCLEPTASEQMLQLLCRYYHAQRSYVLEFTPDGRKIQKVYAWDENQCTSDIEKLALHPPDYWMEYLRCFDQNDIFQSEILFDDTAAESKPEFHRCSLQHVNYRGEHPTSILGFENDIPMKALTFHEASTIALVHKLIQYHLQLAENFQVFRHMADIDTLTGAHTYEAFHTELKKVLGQKPFRPCALVNCDINRFSEVNDIIGHEQADRVLVSLVSSIRRDLQTGELVGRVSADIFSVLVFYQDRGSLQNRVKKWEQTFKNQIKSYNIPGGAAVSVGVYEIQPKEETPATIFDKANAARKLGKGSHVSIVHFYDEGMRRCMLHEKDLEMHMFSSLRDHQFIIYLQPKYRLTDRKVAGAEALVRWQHPTLGFIQPSDFIPLFEKNHFIVELDFFVLDAVCRMLRRWMDEGRPVIPVAVNFSRVHLLTRDFVPRLLQVVRKYDVPPSDLEIELTESAYISHANNVEKIAKELREHGFLMAMDDFGAGYSSLNSLKSLPIDILKLDKNFFREKDPTPREIIIIENIVRLAKQLNLCVVSEGVELDWQAEFLCSIDCDLAQGYLFSRPVPIETFEKMMGEEKNPLLSSQPN